MLFPVLAQTKPIPSCYWGLTFSSNADALPAPANWPPPQKSDSKFIGGIANSAWMTALRTTSIRSSLYYTGDLTADPHVCRSFPSHLLYYMKGKKHIRADAKCTLKSVWVSECVLYSFTLILHVHLAQWEILTNLVTILPWAPETLWQVQTTGLSYLISWNVRHVKSRLFRHNFFLRLLKDL